MAYDSDGSFDHSELDVDIDIPSSASDAAGTSLAGTEALAMAASLMQADSPTTGGWDAPAPVASGSRGMSSSTGWNLAQIDDDDDDVPNSDGGRGDVTAKGRALQRAALRAYTLHPDFCHQSTAEVADQFGHPELDGQSANDQVATMRSTWREVDGARAAVLATRGVLVIAGLAAPANAGHTAVVVPGQPAMSDRKPYPRVCGGGLPMRRSDGSRSAADTWTLKERPQVRYFTPETRSWPMRALGSLFGF
ncbi:MAG: hypothetical protein ABIR54_01475 [Burkholderiaceae bacterium]|jgi:hypothetical protein